MLRSACFASLYSATALAATLHVPADHTTIQGAIDASQDGDRIVVAPGIYYEYSVRFHGKAIEVTGTDPSDRDVVAATVVNAESQSAVFRFTEGEGEASVLCGLAVVLGSGSGIRTSDSSPTIRDCLITGNAAGQGGGIYIYGGAPVLERTWIEANSASGRSGGGLFVTEYARPILRNCVISRNQAVDSYGGGVYLDRDSYLRADNTLFGCNTADASGGAFYMYDGSITLNNCTITKNVAADAGAVMSVRWSYMNAVGCILWNNLPNEIVLDDTATPIITYSNLTESYVGAGNISADPRFIEHSGHSYLLGPNSPAIDTGHPLMPDGLDWAALHPAYGRRNSRTGDMGAFGGPGAAGWLAE